MESRDSKPRSKMRVGNYHVPLPASRIARMIIGSLLIVGGILGFLPVLGFWMIPVGLLVLSQDLASVRRWRRAMAVRLGLWLKPRYPGLAARLGFDGDIAPRRQRGGR